MNLNKSLLIVLAVLMVAACSLTVISAYSDEGSGSIVGDPSDDDYISDDDVDPEIYYDSPSNGGNGNSGVPLTNHPTANPLVLLISALAVIGCSLKFRR